MREYLLAFPFVGFWLLGNAYRAYLAIGAQILVLIYFGVAFLFGAMHRYRQCVQMACSLLLAGVVFYVLAVVGDLVFIGGAPILERVGYRLSGEQGFWGCLLTVFSLSVIAGVAAFFFASSRIRRLLDDQIVLDFRVIAFFERPATRLVLVMLAATCVGCIGEIVYGRISRLQSSESLVQHLVKSNDWQLTTGANAELIRRGRTSVPVIIAAIDAAPLEDKAHRKWGSDQRPWLGSLFNALADIKTDEARQELYKWVGGTEYAPWYRYLIAEKLAKCDDIDWMPLADDMLRAKECEGHDVRYYMLCFVCRYPDTAKLAVALPYVRMAVEDTVLADMNGRAAESMVCILILSRLDSDEARELLARIVHHDGAYRKEVAEAIGEDRLAELLVRYPK